MARPERVAFGLSLASSSSELMNARMTSLKSSSPRKSTALLSYLLLSLSSVSLLLHCDTEPSTKSCYLDGPYIAQLLEGILSPMLQGAESPTTLSRKFTHMYSEEYTLTESIADSGGIG